MSLHHLAQDMAARGRGPDTMLVHMAPNEVAGLQALARAHGGTLTTNPDTGLPEAGILSALLPTLIGAGLAAATGGAGAALIPGLSNAATIGLGVGGLQALRTGSLTKGLMAGLGAYGGAGLMGGIMGAGPAGTGAVSQAAGAELAQAVPASPVAFAEPGVAGAGANEFTQYMQPAAPVAPAVPSAPINVYPEPGVAGAGANEFTQYMQPAAPVTAGVSPTYPPIDWSGQAATINDEAAQRAVIQKLSTTPTTPPFSTFDKLKYGAAALAPALFQEPKSAQAPKDTEQFRYAYNPNREMPPYRAGDVGEYTYFRPSYTRLAADGGMMNELPVERMSARNEYETELANGGQMYAAGGISHLGDYSDGGRLLRGPGDGVSDDIPATIADKRPARLADGEFVVPARIVSELGNGSTEAGARKLYAMMDRVQKNRAKTVGKDKVAVDSRSEKLLPA